jgi:predicted XRE-type DNA-binding protein
MAIRIRKGSRNVFRDLGFPAGDSAHLLIRSDLVISINQILDEQKLTQVQAAKLLGVSQPRVSDLRRGRLERFSIDMLVDLLARLGVAVVIRTKRRTSVA